MILLWVEWMSQKETSFVFYDTETTGINTSFDQILQFGAIKTDGAFNEIEEFNIRSRLLPHVVPDPGAMRVTGVTIGEITKPSLPSHYEMLRQIRKKLLEWSPSIFIGYNSISFDEKLLRQALYTTLHDPYITNTNDSYRADCMSMVQALARCVPNVLSIPTDSRGKQTFKLDRLAPENGFSHGSAHEAIADVKATIHMCRLMAERAPNYWSSFIQLARKKDIINFMSEASVFCLTGVYFGKAYPYMMTAIGANPENESEVLVFDLSQDPDELGTMSDGELAAWFQRSPKPVRAVRANSYPIVLEYDKAPENIRNSLPSLAELKQKAVRIRSDSDLSNRLIDAFFQLREPREPSPYVEGQIYEGFVENKDRALMDRFHDLDWPQRPALVEKISDERIRWLGKRLIYMESPDAIPESIRTKHDVDIARRLMSDEEVPWLTLPKALQEVNDLLDAAKESEKAMLCDLRDYLTQRSEEASSLLT